MGSPTPEHIDRRQRRYSGRVLLVSARPDERQLLADCLNSGGFCVLEAHSAADAYRWASEVAVSIVITDVELLEDEDGRCLARKLKEGHRTHQYLW